MVILVHLILDLNQKKLKKQYFNVDYRALKDNSVLWPSKFNYKLKVRKGEQRWLDEYLKKFKTKKFLKEKKESKRGSKEKQIYERKDMIITKEYRNKYYLHISYVKNKKVEKANYDVCSIDPGVRSLHTFYSPEGVCGKIGDNLSKKLMKIYNKIDILKSLITKTNKENNKDSYYKNKRTRSNMKRRCVWLKTKASNIVNDFHWKAASFYCKNFELIVIPKLDTKSLQKKIKKQFGLKSSSKRIREMMILSHSRLVDRIIYKAKEYNRKVLIVEEHYTSQTCGNCGILKKDLGSNKILKCDNCKSILDRDINGSRNILLNVLTKVTC